MEGVLQVAGMERSSGGSGGRAPLSSIPRNTAGSVASGRSRKSGRRGSASRAQAGSAQAESHHVQRLRASRSAGDIGFSSSLYAPSSVEKPLLAQASLYASASAAELGGFGFDKQSSQRSRRVGSAPRERLAARRRSNKPADKSARMVSAVQGLDQSSKQALLGVIKMERERKTTQQQREAELEQMHQEAAHNSRSAESEQQVFDALGMLDSTEVAQQAEAGLRILQFCATAPEPCHAMMSRALAVFARLRQAHGDVAAERDAAVQQERRKWHEKEVEAERRHKEAASKLGASLGSEMQTMKQQLASASAERDAAQKQVEELKASQAKDARKIERLSAKVAELQSDTGSGAGASDKAADAEVLSLRDAVAAAESELSTMKTRLKKMMAKGKKDKATIEELNEAVEHNRAQLGAQMEENETLRTAIDALQTPDKSEPEAEPEPSAEESEDLTDFAGKLKDLEIAASRGQAPTLNIERGTGEPSPSALDAEPVDLEADLSALEQQGADAGESVFGSLDIGDLTVSDSPAGKADGMFGTDDTSPIAATDTTTMVLAAEKSSGDLGEWSATRRSSAGLALSDPRSFAGTDAAFTAVGEVESLKRECDELRLRNAELEAALTDAYEPRADFRSSFAGVIRVAVRTGWAAMTSRMMTRHSAAPRSSRTRARWRPWTAPQSCRLSTSSRWRRNSRRRTRPRLRPRQRRRRARAR